jgi:hypothetical protein
MKIPSKIRIGGIDYIIENEKDLNDGSHMLSGQIVYQEGKHFLTCDLFARRISVISYAFCNLEPFCAAR